MRAVMARIAMRIDRLLVPHPSITWLRGERLSLLEAYSGEKLYLLAVGIVFRVGLRASVH